MAQNIFRNAIAWEAIKCQILVILNDANECYGTKNHQDVFNKMLTNGSAY